MFNFQEPNDQDSERRVTSSFQDCMDSLMVSSKVLTLRWEFNQFMRNAAEQFEMPGRFSNFFLKTVKWRDPTLTPRSTSDSVGVLEVPTLVSERQAMHSSPFHYQIMWGIVVIVTLLLSVFVTAHGATAVTWSLYLSTIYHLQILQQSALHIIEKDFHLMILFLCTFCFAIILKLGLPEVRNNESEWGLLFNSRSSRPGRTQRCRRGGGRRVGGHLLHFLLVFAHF